MHEPIHRPGDLRQPILCVAAAILFAGCGGGGGISGTVPVTGKVTYNGQAVEGATVSFIGEGRPAIAVTDASGNYDLRTLDSRGALPGQYSVVVAKTEQPASPGPVSMEEAAAQAGQSPPAPKELLPSKYATAAQSPLKFEVKAGQTNNFDLELTD